MRTLWSSSAVSLFVFSHISWTQCLEKKKTHSDFEGGPIGMVMQSTSLYGQSFKRKEKKRKLEFW